MNVNLSIEINFQNYKKVINQFVYPSSFVVVLKLKNIKIISFDLKNNKYEFHNDYVESLVKSRFNQYGHDKTACLIQGSLNDFECKFPFMTTNKEETINVVQFIKETIDNRLVEIKRELSKLNYNII